MPLVAASIGRRRAPHRHQSAAESETIAECESKCDIKLYIFQLKSLKCALLLPSIRHCFHPGASKAIPLGGLAAKEIGGREILLKLWQHIWPKDAPFVKRRIVLAVGLLVAAKVRTKKHKSTISSAAQPARAADPAALLRALPGAQSRRTVNFEEWWKRWETLGFVNKAK